MRAWWNAAAQPGTADIGPADPGPVDPGARDLQARIESTAGGRAAISGVVLFLLVSFAVSNLPDSRLKEVGSHAVRRVRDALGLEQAWNVFAPDPRAATFDLRARIRFSDGSVRVWRVPGGDPFLSPYRTYHWQKWAEAVRLDARSALWRPFAEWVARTQAPGGKRPVEVVLVRRWYDLFPPGARRSRGAWNEYAFFTLPVTPEVLGGSR
jgi:hypothetical protein